MKQRFAFLFLLLVLLLTGCNRALVLKTSLEPDEEAATGDVVYVDGNPAGLVKQIVREGEHRIALLAVNEDRVTREKIRAGVVRVLEEGKISLRTGVADAGAPILTSGQTIPVMTKTGFTVRHLTSIKTLSAVLAGLALLAMVLICFRWLARGWLLLLTLVLSGWIAWIAVPWAGYAVAKVYVLLPPSPSATSPGSSQDAGAESPISRLMERRPDPETVGYAAVFIATFIAVSVVMRGAQNRLAGQK